MISRKVSVLLIGVLLLFYPRYVNAVDNPGFSKEVATFMETDGMTVFEDPEIKDIQAELAGYGQNGTEELTDEETEKATRLINHLLTSMDRVAKEYMSGERVPEKPVHTVQNYKELPSCVDDGSCSEEEKPEQSQRPQLTQQPKRTKRTQQTQQPEQFQQPHLTQQPEQPKQSIAEEHISFGDMLNNNKTDSIEDVRASLKL